MAAEKQLPDDIPFDADRLPLRYDARASDDAIAILDEIRDECRATAVVRDYAVGERPGNKVGSGQFVTALARADDLVLVTWTSMGITAIAPEAEGSKCVVVGYGAVAEKMGKDPYWHERASRSSVKDTMAWSRPMIVTRDESKLIGRVDGEGGSDR